MTRVFSVWLFIMTLACPVLVAAQTQPLENSAAECDNEVQQQVAKLKDEYKQALAKSKQKYQDDGDFDRAMAFHKELERFSSENRLDSDNLVQLPKELRDLQTKYIAAPEKLRKKIAQEWILKLDEAKRDLTKKGNLDEAMAVNNEAEKIARSYHVLGGPLQIPKEKLPKYVTVTENLSIPVIVDGQQIGVASVENGRTYRLLRVDGFQVSLNVAGSVVTIPVDATDLVPRIQSAELGGVPPEVANEEMGSEPSTREPEAVQPSVEGSKLAIVRAVYGAEQTWMDVTDVVRRMVRSDSLSVQVGNHVFGRDPIFGKVKTLRLTYQYGGRRRTVEAGEGSTITIP